MKKKLTTLLAASFLTLALVACGSNKGKSGGDNPPPPTRYTVAFDVEGTRFQTLRLEENSHIDEASVNTPNAPEGYVFEGWYDHADLTYKLDFETYTVTHDVTFDAKFVEDEEPDPYPDLDVEAVKEADHEYYLSFGWWEALNEDGTPKGTSNLKVKDAKVIYANILTYLRATDVSEQDIANIQFRNYSSVDVATMGAAVNEDNDVEILFGVGNNINSSAGVSLKNGNDGKFSAPHGSTGTSRYVANPAVSSDKGTEIFNWMKNTDCGKAALVRALTQQEVEDSIAVVIDYTVKIHGETVQEVHITEAGTNITPTTVVVPEGYHMTGYATQEDGEVVIVKESETAAITYAEIVANAAQDGTLDLYPVFEENVVAEEDLVAYIQVSGSYLYSYEAELLEARFNETLSNGEKVRIEAIEGDADTFKNAVNAKADADILIGGNKPVDGMKKAETTTANAGLKHFKSANRKVVYASTINSDHQTLATALYDFVRLDAPSFEVYTAFWRGTDNAWVSDAERTAALAGIEGKLNDYFAISGDGNTLQNVYNIVLTFNDVTVQGNAVADLGAITNALRDGKGVDLIIGCGKNVKSAGGVNDVEHRLVDASFLSQGSRYISLVRENFITRYIYDNLYVVQQQGE